MRTLRLILIALSAMGAAFMIYIFSSEASGRILTATYAAGLLLNAAFLWTTRATKLETPGRIARLVRLWLDVKEADLKRRASV